jgi:uncharacterized protein
VEDVSPPAPRPPGAGPLSPVGVAVAAAMAVFVLFVVTSPVQLLNLAFGVWFSQLFVFLGGGWLLLRATGRAPARYTGLSRGTPALAAFGFAVGLANFVGLVAPLQYAAQKLLPPAWQDYDVAGLFLGQSTGELVFIGLGVGLGAPLCEEFFFRGVFFQGLHARGGPPWRALVTSAVLFSAFHLDRMGFLARVELGLVFGWLLWRTGSLWPGVLAHAANNLVSLALFFGARHVSVQPPSSPRSEALAVALMLLVGCAVLAGLFALARRLPSLLGPPRPVDAHEEPEPPVFLEPLTRLLWLVVPWMLAATLSLGAYVVLDPLGVQLSRIDWRYRLAPVPQGAPDVLHAERQALYELRVRAHQGEVPLGQYISERARQARRDGTP